MGSPIASASGRCDSAGLDFGRAPYRTCKICVISDACREFAPGIGGLGTRPGTVRAALTPVSADTAVGSRELR